MTWREWLDRLLLDAAGLALWLLLVLCLVLMAVARCR